MNDRVSVEFRVPSTALAPLISTFYEIEIAGTEPVVDCLPPEWANIQTGIDQPWDLGPDRAEQLQPTVSRIVLRGPTRGPTWVSGRGRAFGIGILPTGWSRLWPYPCHLFADRIVCLSDLVGSKECNALRNDLQSAADFEERIAIAERWLSARLGATPPNPAHSLIDRLFSRLNDPEPPELEGLAEWLGVSATQFARLCKRAFGYPPKLLLRRQRWMRMLGEMHSRPYSEWRDFIDPHYVDQSHMLRDFREFLGMSPTAYFALPRPILSATTRSRAAAAGKPYQILHDPDAANPDG